MCRAQAKQFSSLKPQLDDRKISLVGVGLEEIGLEDFVKGEFFTGGRERSAITFENGIKCLKERPCVYSFEYSPILWLFHVSLPSAVVSGPDR